MCGACWRDAMRLGAHGVQGCKRRSAATKQRLAAAEPLSLRARQLWERAAGEVDLRPSRRRSLDTRSGGAGSGNLRLAGRGGDCYSAEIQRTEWETRMWYVLFRGRWIGK